MVERGEAAFTRVAELPHPHDKGPDPSLPQTVESPAQRGFFFTRPDTLRLPPEDGSPAHSPAHPEDNLKVIEEGLRAIHTGGPSRSSNNKDLDALMDRIEALNSALSRPTPSYVRGG
jgi:hypothetical protein